MTAFEVKEHSMPSIPYDTALGALLHHITGGAEAETFQPMNINFGLFPELETKAKGDDKKRLLSERALKSLDMVLPKLT